MPKARRKANSAIASLNWPWSTFATRSARRPARTPSGILKIAELQNCGQQNQAGEDDNDPQRDRQIGKRDAAPVARIRLNKGFFPFRVALFILALPIII